MNTRMMLPSLLNGASGVITHGDDGWIILKLNDVNQLSLAIKKYFDHPLHPGMDRVEDYSEKINFDRVTTIFKGLLKRRYE